MNRTPPAQQALQRIPKKWAVAIVVALILYALLQPFASSRWGWKLPSLASVLGVEQPSPKIIPKSTSPTKSSSQSSTETLDEPIAPDTDRDQSSNAQSTEVQSTEAQSTEPSQESSQKSSQRSADSNTAKSPATRTQSTTSKTSDSNAPKSSNSTSSDAAKSTAAKEDTSNLLYGLLKDAGREVYISPAGLRYTRGSEEGHRLKHIEKHLKDIPDRPGKHGVFDGDLAQVIRWIDDAYTRGKQGAKGVRKRDEDGRTVYEVPFTKPIGYIGGRDGKRDNNPDAKRLRLVVDGDQVITAFPF